MLLVQKNSPDCPSFVWAVTLYSCESGSTQGSNLKISKLIQTRSNGSVQVYGLVLGRYYLVGGPGLLGGMLISTN